MKFILNRRAVVVGLAAVFMATTAMAEDRGTKDEAKAMVEAALSHIKKAGVEQSYKDFTQDKANWTKKDLYVFVMDSTGKMLSHGANEKLVGKDLINLKDSSGKAFVVEMIATAKKGSGWVDYEWADPLTKKVDGKASYVKAVPSSDTFVGVGVYR
jgi:signal transduction histidine kinase